jgi:hypothetical protein
MAPAELFLVSSFSLKTNQTSALFIRFIHRGDSFGLTIRNTTATVAAPSANKRRATASEAESATIPTSGDAAANTRVDNMFLTDRTVALVDESMREWIE